MSRIQLSRKILAFVAAFGVAAAVPAGALSLGRPLTASRVRLAPAVAPAPALSARASSRLPSFGLALSGSKKTRAFIAQSGRYFDQSVERRSGDLGGAGPVSGSAGASRTGLSRSTTRPEKANDGPPADPREIQYQDAWQDRWGLVALNASLFSGLGGVVAVGVTALLHAAGAIGGVSRAVSVELGAAIGLSLAFAAAAWLLTVNPHPMEPVPPGKKPSRIKVDRSD